MACNNVSKPSTIDRPNSIFGAPQGTPGRTFNCVNYGIQGIVLHCTDMTISQYVQYLACLSQPVPGSNTEVNHHYSIGSAGSLNQHINDSNISWTFGSYGASAYPSPPAPSLAINWPTLQNANGVAVSPDVYVLNILIAKSYNGATNCLTSTGLPAEQHEKLVQLLAYLSSTYDIPLDADHINFHDNIAAQSCPSNECACKDISCLLTDINSFCEEDCTQVSYSEVACNDISHILATPDSCSGSGGCVVKVPFDACCFGHLPAIGEISQFVGVAAPDSNGQLCLVKNSIKTSAPITGEGTTASPLSLDLCNWDSFVPMYDPGDPDCPTTTVSTIIGVGDDGCLIRLSPVDTVPGYETPLTVIDSATIDLTASGTNGHTLQADLKLSTANGNLLTVDDTGLLVTFNCTDISGLFSPGVVANLYGSDANGACVSQDVTSVISGAICDVPIDTGTPLHILGKNTNQDCPVLFTPNQIVAAGLTVSDTDSIDLTLDGNNVLTASVILDPDPDNRLTITTNGLFVTGLTPNALDDCITVDITNGQLNIGLNIDLAADNILECTPNGLYAQDISVVSTNCLDLSYDADTREISGDIIFAPSQAGVTNVASCLNDGLYVQRGANALVNAPLIGDGSEGNPLDINFSLLDSNDLCDLGDVIPTTLSLTNIVGTDNNDCLRKYTGEEFIDQFLTINNGDCITATVTNGVLNIEPVISPPVAQLNNVLSCTSTGLFVPQGAGITPQPTSCVDIQLVNGVLTSTLIFDPDSLNQISCRPTGLYVERGAGLIGGVTNCIQTVVSNGQVTASPIISPAILGVANALTCEASGLFVPTGAGLVAVSDDCIDVTFNQANGELTITPVISPLTDNLLQCTANGLYVPGGFVQSVTSTTCIAVNVTGNSLSVTPVIDPDATNLLSCRTNGLYAGLKPEIFADSNCIDFDVNNGQVTATPILAPDQGQLTNVLQCLPGGLFVPIGGGLTTLNSDCLTLQIVSGVLTADIRVDTVSQDNAIMCGPNGLYVPECCPLVVDTNTVNLTLNDPRTISAEVIIDPDPTNAIVANPNGLYAPNPLITSVADSSCLSVDVVNGLLTITPNISTQPDNAIQCLGDGFFVPNCCPLVTDTDSVDLTLTGTRTISANVVIDPDPTNGLVINPNGLYAPEAFITDISNANTCVDIDVVNGVLSVVPVISPDIDNQLVCNANGLYVPPAATVTPTVYTGDDTDCISLTVQGTVITASPIIDPALDNMLQCLATGLYVPEPFITTVTASNDCISLDVTNGLLTASIIVDPATDNALTCGPNGLYVPECCPIVTDTTTVDLTLTGTREISADVIIDPAANNALVANPGGLFVAEPPIVSVIDTPCMDLEIVSGVLTATPIISAQTDNAITCEADGLYVPSCCPIVTDTTTVDLTLTGTREISAEVIVDPDPTNTLTVTPDGLFVATPAITDVMDTPCIDLEVVGGVLTATPIVSTQADNAIQCAADGLYVPDCCPLVVDTTTVDLTLTGTRTISAEVLISAAPNNSLIVNPDGLYVPEAFITDISNLNTCITVDVTNGVLSVVPVIDPAVDNQLVCGANGLYVPPATTTAQLIYTGIDTDCISVVVQGTEISASPIVDPNLTNTLQCLPTGLFVPEPAVTSVVSGDCINADLTNGVLTISALVDPAADNLLTCEATGLYVAPIATIDTPCFAFTFANNTLSGQPIISAQADNVITCAADGLYVPDCCPIVTDTTTVDLTLTGTREISAEVIVDPNPDNALVINPTGLFVPTPAVVDVLDTPCIDLEIISGVLTATPIISAQADNSITCEADGLYVPNCCPLVEDTDSVDMVLTGTRTISANVLVDPDLTNSLVVNPNGLYVPEAFITDVLATPCMTPTVTGGVLTVDPVISAQVDNAITCEADGLFVPNCCPLVEDTSSVDLTLTGTRTISAEVIVDPDPTNALVINPTGLYVPEAFITDVLSTDCLDITVTGGVLTINPIISPLADNQLVCQPDGLYVAPPLTAVDSTCLDLDITAGVLTANPIISAQADNVIECLADGFYVPNCCPIVTDTTTVDLTLTGTREISAEVIVDPDPTNSLVINPTGLYVPTPFITDVIPDPCIDVTVVNGVMTIMPVISATADNMLTCEADGFYVPPLTAIDTPCIDLEIVGNTISATPIISAQADNKIQCVADGLYVPDCCPVVIDTDSVDLTLVGTNGIQADVIIDPDPTNAIVINPDGLYAPTAFITDILDTQCFDLDVTGGVLSVNPIIDPAADNQLVCGPDGLYVPLLLTTLDTPCISLLLTGNVLTANPIVDPDVCNILECRANGLFVPGLTITEECIPMPDGVNNVNVISIDTNCDGVADFQFCEGICEIVTTNDCTDGGVGADYMLKEFNLDCGVLTINSAPEHFSTCERAFVVNGGGSDVGHAAGVQTRVQHNANPSVLVTNPSLCRDLVVQVVGQGDIIAQDWTINDTSSNAWILAVQLFADGVQIGGERSYTNHDLREGQTAGELEAGNQLTTATEFTIPPGGAVTFDVRILTDIETTNEFDRSTVLAEISVCGTTT